jgi:hypothetical protein
MTSIIKFICKRIDITGIVIKGWPQLYNVVVFFQFKSLVVVIEKNQ